MNASATPRRTRGQTLVEFALLLPVLITLIIAVFDFSYYLFTLVSVNAATQVAVRRAAMNNLTNAQIKTLVMNSSVGTLLRTQSIKVLTQARDSGYPDQGRPPTVQITCNFDHHFWGLGYVGVNSLPIKSSYKSVVVTTFEEPTIAFTGDPP